MSKWLLACALLLAGCSAHKDNTIKLAYVQWSSAVAATEQVQKRLEAAGFTVKLVPVTAGAMWAGVASGSVDATVSAWLPQTQAQYAKLYLAKVEDLGPNLEGVKLGLAVPQNSPLQSITDLKSFNGPILGIDPGAGLMTLTKRAMGAYGLGNKLLPGSGPAMGYLLKRAVKEGRPVVVTAWWPHLIVEELHLRFLDDPKGIYPQGESVHTLVSRSLKAQHPKAYAILKGFHWTPRQVLDAMRAARQ